MRAAALASLSKAHPLTAEKRAPMAKKTTKFFKSKKLNW